jgi:GT2 family glycosyltransferase
MSQPDLSIIIVNKDTRELLSDCLQSVFRTAGALQLEIWVVDNASTDQSVDMLRTSFPQVNIIVNSTNRGFAKANNQAISLSHGRYFLLLNSDTAVLPDTLQTLVKSFNEESGAGVIGPQLLNADGSIQPSAGSFPSLWSEFLFQSFLFKIWPSSFPYGHKVHPVQTRAYNTIRQVDWVTGAALAIRASVVEQIGALDEAIFMYGEDLDWCWRVKHTGLQVVYTPQAKVIHYIGVSSHRNFSSWIANYTQATLTFFQRHYSRWSLDTVCVLIMLGSAARVVALGALGGLLQSTRPEIMERAAGYRQAYRLALHTLVAGRSNSG